MNLPDTLRTVLIWGALALAVSVPIAAAGFSPLLQWRDPIYIAAGFAGIVGMALMLVQPLLAAALLPALSQQRSRRIHHVMGVALVLAVIVHIAGLWITSPPDVVDVLLFRSPTPFAIWGALAMWAVFAAATLALLRGRLSLRAWRWCHTLLVSVAVAGTVLHVVQIEGTMEGMTKAILSLCVIAALITAIARRKVWAMGLRPRSSRDRSG